MIVTEGVSNDNAPESVEDCDDTDIIVRAAPPVPCGDNEVMHESEDQ